MKPALRILSTQFLIQVTGNSGAGRESPRSWVYGMVVQEQCQWPVAAAL